MCDVCIKYIVLEACLQLAVIVYLQCLQFTVSYEFYHFSNRWVVGKTLVVVNLAIVNWICKMKLRSMCKKKQPLLCNMLYPHLKDCSGGRFET